MPAFISQRFDENSQNINNSSPSVNTKKERSPRTNHANKKIYAQKSVNPTDNDIMLAKEMSLQTYNKEVKKNYEDDLLHEFGISEDDKDFFQALKLSLSTMKVEDSRKNVSFTETDPVIYDKIAAYRKCVHKLLENKDYVVVDKRDPSTSASGHSNLCGFNSCANYADLVYDEKYNALQLKDMIPNLSKDYVASISDVIYILLDLLGLDSVIIATEDDKSKSHNFTLYSSTSSKIDFSIETWVIFANGIQHNRVGHFLVKKIKSLN